MKHIALKYVKTDEFPSEAVADFVEQTRTTMTARACFALNVTYRWCLTGTPLQNRIGEFFSLIRFLEITPYASYFCKDCPCSTLEWSMADDSRCEHC